MKHALAFAIALFTLPLFAQSPPGNVAMLVTAPADQLEAPLAAALKDPAASVRTIAARVANVRKVATLLPLLRETLQKESNAEAAREEMRAIGMMGGPAEMTGLLEQSKRFAGALDDDALIAIARGNGQAAIPVYFGSLRGRNWSTGQLEHFFRAALWGRTGLVTPTASRALGTSDEKAWRAVLRQVTPPAKIDTGVLTAGLTSKSPAINADTAWYLASLLAGDPSTDPAALQEAMTRAAAARTGSASAAELLGYEMLTRALGNKASANDDLWRRLAADHESWRVDWRADPIDRVNEQVNCGPSGVVELMTPAERAIVCTPKTASFANAARAKTRSVEVAPPPYTLLVDLPKGVAADVVDRTGCRGQWIGNVAATADSAGRITALDMKDVDTTAQCRRALEVLIPLTLVDNESMSSPFTSPGLIVVKAREAEVCADESDVNAAVNDPELAGTPRIGSLIKAPKVQTRAEPPFTDAARLDMKRLGMREQMLIVESRISETGCVAPLRLLRASTIGDINRSALLALSRWRFAPATWNGKPVPVIFNLTLSYKIN